MRLDKILIGIGIFMLFITVGLGVMFGIGGSDKGIFSEDSYDVNASSSSLLNLTHDISEVYGISDDMKDDTLTQSIDEATGWENMVTGGYKALRTFMSTFNIAGNIIEAIGKEGGLIPAKVVSITMVLFSVIIIFTVVYMLFRFMPRD